MPAKHTHILLIRFSAMGDVAMTVPVIKELLLNYPSLTITIVSNKSFEAFFKDVERLNFFPADLKGIHKGFPGLFSLFLQIKKRHAITAVGDLHNVIRSKILGSFFRLSGLPVSTIDKGRKEKRELVRKEQKIFRPLKTTHQRYADVLYRLGYSFVLSNKVERKKQLTLANGVLHFLAGMKREMICIAPFAKHKEKMYPWDKIREVVETLAAEKFDIVLLGGGKEEKLLLEQLAHEVPNIFSAAGRFTLEEEMQIIQNCSLMVSMDSANMHLAALLGVPVISIWGATHPFAGFLGYGLTENNAVQIDLSCRPCSVFGNKPCWRGDHACMNAITPAMVLDKIHKIFTGV
ncbi:MAG: glycosyltransferase family 9 protein [Ferruginibacter sp.]